MTINTKALAAGIATVGITLQQAITITEEVVNLIGLAETALEGASGDVKFQAVIAGLDQVVAQMGLSEKLATIKAKVGPVVNFTVKALNAALAWEKQFAGLFGALKSLNTQTPPPPVNVSAGAQLSAGGAATPPPGA